MSARKTYTKEFKVDLLVYKIRHPKMSYSDLCFKYKVSKASINAWANDNELIDDAMGIVKNPEKSKKLEILRLERKLLDKKENVKEMLFDTLDNLYNDLDNMKNSDKIRFASVLKEVVNTDVFKDKTGPKTKSIVEELIQKYGIDKSNIAQA